MPKRVDGNQPEIVKELRKVPGCTVAVTSDLGDGFPDLVVGYSGQTYLMEIKDGSKPPSRRRLTPAERKFFGDWTGGPLRIIESAGEAIAFVTGHAAEDPRHRTTSGA